MSRIDRMAVEVEGGWNARPPGWDIHTDTSVRIPDAPCTGEISSPPYSLKENLFLWLREVYPQYVNNTCGLHIHVSVNSDEDYALLMDYKFYAAFKQAYVEFVQIETAKDSASSIDKNELALLGSRLAGRNRYCRDNYNPDKQIKIDGRSHPEWDHRYSALNYCYTRHGTVESRVLPMFTNIELSMRALDVFINLVEQFLESDSAKSEVAATSSIDEPEDNEETVIEIKNDQGQVIENNKPQKRDPIAAALETIW